MQSPRGIHTTSRGSFPKERMGEKEEFPCFLFFCSDILGTIFSLSFPHIGVQREIGFLFIVFCHELKNAREREKKKEESKMREKIADADAR